MVLHASEGVQSFGVLLRDFAAPLLEPVHMVVHNLVRL